MVTCQFSLYPLRTEAIGPSLENALKAVRDAGLEPQTGTMSTYVDGEASAIFEGLRRAFAAAAAEGDVVLVMTVSNACGDGEQTEGVAPQHARGAD